MFFNSLINSPVVATLVMGPTHTPEAVLFWFLAPLSVLAALAAVFAKKAVHSALFIAWIMVSLAIFYVAQGALFLGIVQVVVYTGAVMMLFLFILMLVGVDTSDSLVETIKGQKVAAILVALGIGGLLTSLIGRAVVGSPAVGLDAANSGGNVQGVAD
jgi:NADH-quinone oxidoreductase subunit J